MGNNETTVCSEDDQQGSDMDKNKSNNVNMDKQMSSREGVENNISAATQGIEQQPCQVVKAEHGASSNSCQQDTNISSTETNNSKLSVSMVSLDFSKDKGVMEQNLVSNKLSTALDYTFASNNNQQDNIKYNTLDINTSSHSNGTNGSSRDEYYSLDNEATVESAKSLDKISDTTMSKEQQDLSCISDLVEVNVSSDNTSVASIKHDSNIPKNSAFATAQNIVTPNTLHKDSNKYNSVSVDNDKHDDNSLALQTNNLDNASSSQPVVSILGNISLQSRRDTRKNDSPPKLFTTWLTTNNKNNIKKDQMNVGNDNCTDYLSCIEGEDYADDGIRSDDDLGTLNGEVDQSKPIGGVQSQPSDTNDAASSGVSNILDSYDRDNTAIMQAETSSISGGNRLHGSPTERDFIFGFTGFGHKGTEYCKDMMRSYVRNHPEANRDDFMDEVDTILKGRQCFLYKKGSYIAATEAVYDRKLRQMFSDLRKALRKASSVGRAQESLVTDLNCTDPILTRQVELHCGATDERNQASPAYDSDDSSLSAASVDESDTSVPYTDQDVLLGNDNARHPGSERLSEVIQSIIHDRNFQTFTSDVVTRVKQIMDGARYFTEEGDKFVEATERQVYYHIRRNYSNAKSCLSRREDMEATLTVDSPPARHTNHAKVRDVILNRSAYSYPGTVECRKVIHRICRDTPSLTRSQFLEIVRKRFMHNRFLVEADGVHRQATADERDEKLWIMFYNCRRYYRLSQNSGRAASNNNFVCSASSNQTLDVEDSDASNKSMSSRVFPSVDGNTDSVDTNESGSSSGGEVILRDSDILCGVTGKHNKGTVAYRAIYRKWCDEATDMPTDKLVRTIHSKLQGRRFVKKTSTSFHILSEEEQLDKIGKNCREYCTRNNTKRPKSALKNRSIEPSDTDVILGESPPNHPGTIAYRETVQQLSIDYPKMATDYFFRSLQRKMKNSRFFTFDNGRYHVADRSVCIAKSWNLYLDCLSRNRPLDNQDIVNSDAESNIPATATGENDEESEIINVMSYSGNNNDDGDGDGDVDANKLRDTDVICTAGGVRNSGSKEYTKLYQSLCRERPDLTFVQITELVLDNFRAYRFVKKTEQALTVLTAEERYNKVLRNCKEYCYKYKLKRSAETALDTAADIADNDSTHSRERGDDIMAAQSVDSISNANNASDSVNNDASADGSIEDDNILDGSVDRQQNVAAVASDGPNIYNKHYFTTSWHEFLTNAKTHCERIKAECVQAMEYRMLPTFKLHDKLLEIISHYEETYTDLDGWRNEDRDYTDDFVKLMNESEQQLRNFIRSVVYNEIDADA